MKREKRLRISKKEAVTTRRREMLFFDSFVSTKTHPTDVKLAVLAARVTASADTVCRRHWEREQSRKRSVESGFFKEKKKNSGAKERQRN